MQQGAPAGPERDEAPLQPRPRVPVIGAQGDPWVRPRRQAKTLPPAQPAPPGGRGTALVPALGFVPGNRSAEKECAKTKAARSLYATHRLGGLVARMVRLPDNDEEEWAWGEAPPPTIAERALSKIFVQGTESTLTSARLAIQNLAEFEASQDVFRDPTRGPSISGARLGQLQRSLLESNAWMDVVGRVHKTALFLKKGLGLRVDTEDHHFINTAMIPRRAIAGEPGNARKPWTPLMCVAHSYTADLNPDEVESVASAAAPPDEEEGARYFRLVRQGVAQRLVACNDRAMVIDTARSIYIAVLCMGGHGDDALGSKVAALEANPAALPTDWSAPREGDPEAVALGIPGGAAAPAAAEAWIDLIIGLPNQQTLDVKMCVSITITAASPWLAWAKEWYRPRDGLKFIFPLTACEALRT